MDSTSRTPLPHLMLGEGGQPASRANLRDEHIPRSSDEGDIERTIRETVEERLRPIVHEEVAREEEQRFRQLKWIIAFVGLVGVGTFGTLSNYLIEKAVESRIEHRTGNISDSLEFVRFYTLTLKLELGTEFSSDDRDAIMTYLRKAARNDTVRHSPEFVAALSQTARAFASATQSASIDEIFSLFEREILASTALVEPLLHHYGQDIVARLVPPADDVSLANFGKLERLAAASKVPELALYYRLLFQFKQNPRNDDADVARLLKHLPQLNETDLARLIFELLTHSNARNWQRQPSLQGLEIERVTREFLVTFEPSLVNHLLIEAAIIEAARRGDVDKDDADRAGVEAAARLKNEAGA